MSEEYKKITRRKILKSSGGSFAATGVVGASSAESAPSVESIEENNIIGDEKTKFIQEVRESERVKSVLSALQNPVEHFDESEVKLYRAEQIVVKVAIIPTELREIYYARYGESESQLNETTAEYFINNRKEIPSNLASQISNTPAILTGKPNKAVLSHSPSEKREREIAKAASKEVDDVTVFEERTITDNQNLSTADPAPIINFTVKTIDSSDNGSTLHGTQTPTGQISFNKKVETTGGDCSAADCGKSWCFRCMQASGTCAACYMACSAAPPACVVCLTATCGASGWSCTACLCCNT